MVFMTNKIKSLRGLKKWHGKTVFLRVDFNVPIVNGKIREDYKIKSGLKTIEYLSDHGARVLIVSHLGDPAGMFEAAYSLRPVATRLRALLKRPIKFLPLDLKKSTKLIKALPPGGLALLENIRFYSGEYENDVQLAKSLSELADVYVNDAFAVSHRQQASVSAIKKYLPAYAGLLLEDEVRALNKILQPKKPLVVVMGGAKIKTKAPLIKKLQQTASQILLGGGLANTFFYVQGLEIGRSLFDSDGAKYVKKFFKNKKLSNKIKLPLDLIVKNRVGVVRVASPQEIKKSDRILDIGPYTIAVYSAEIKKAKTLIWNGPMGKFEERSFRSGTLAMASLIAARSSGIAYGVVGGGETVEALKLAQVEQYVDWVSTAGGAMLSYLSGEKMPGLSKIIN